MSNSKKVSQAPRARIEHQKNLVSFEDEHRHGNNFSDWCQHLKFRPLRDHRHRPTEIKKTCKLMRLTCVHSPQSNNQVPPTKLLSLAAPCGIPAALAGTPLKDFRCQFKRRAVQLTPRVVLGVQLAVPMKTTSMSLLIGLLEKIG